MKHLIVTAGDDNFSGLLKGLLRSLHSTVKFNSLDIACFDVGLSEENRQYVLRHVHHLTSPSWDLPVNEKLKRTKPHLRAITARPFLRDYFPGYETYIWMDADTWVQRTFALDWLIQASQDNAVAICSHSDRAYTSREQVFAWRFNRLRQYYGEFSARRVQWAAYYNAGVFALKATAPHWEKWATWFRNGLIQCGGCLVSDQTALNQTLWQEGLAVHPLPACCNWLCHLALPVYDLSRSTFVGPYFPLETIGILHLSGDSKDTLVPINSSPGESLAIGLRHGDPLIEFPAHKLHP